MTSWGSVAARGEDAGERREEARERGEDVDRRGDDIAERREAVGELAAAVRALTEATVRTEAPVETIREITRRLTACVSELAADQRRLGQPDPLDDPATMLWFRNPVVGRGNPFSAPVTTTLVDGVLVGRCTLGMAYQGPRGYAHGGMSALLLDQILGDAVTASGRPGLTVSLSTRYRRPVPLFTPLLVTGRVVEVAHRKTTAEGSIALATEPENPLVEGVGIFVAPRPDQVARIFGSSRLAARDTAFPGPPAPAGH